MIRSYEQYIEDLSQLTGLPLRIVRKLLRSFKLIIGHELYESMIEDSGKMESLFMGLGKLEVEYNSEADDYDIRFKLSKDMKTIITKMLDEQKSPLDEELSKWLANQVLDKFRGVIEDE